MQDEKASRLFDRIRHNRERWHEEGFTPVPESAAEKFAQLRGLSVSRPFNPERLFASASSVTRDKRQLVGDQLDHFIDARGWPWGVVVHGGFNHASRALAYGRRHSLCFEEIESWYRPAGCAVFLSRRARAN